MSGSLLRVGERAFSIAGARIENDGSLRKTEVAMDGATAAQQVVAAADRLFYERGIRTVGMDDIRDASGVSLKRLYRLFPAKEELAEEVLRRREAAFLR